MRASISKWRSVGAMAFLASGLVHCSQSTPVQQSTVSESQAQSDVEFRLTKTQQVRTQLSALQDTIRPFGSILHDLGKAVDLKIDQHPGGVVGGLLDRVSLILQSAVNGMVETHPDGSWTLEHPTPLSLVAGSPGSCPRSHIRLSGVKVPDGEQIIIAMSSCSNPRDFEKLATIQVSSSGTRLVTISSATFENLQGQSVSLDPCTLNVDASNNSELSCTPLVFVTGPAIVSVDHLEFRTDAQGTHAAVHATWSDAEQGPQGATDLVVEPGTAINLHVCERGQPCGP